jgi:hypothetical protein
MCWILYNLQGLDQGGGLDGGLGGAGQRSESLALGGGVAALAGQADLAAASEQRARVVVEILNGGTGAAIGCKKSK